MKRLFRSKQEDQLIYPGDRDNVYLWTKKWRITDAQLNDAIIETGSIQARELRRYLVGNGAIFSVSSLIEKIKGKRELY